ncbi:hypothetical protein BH11MYX1_BH11MYX1_56030 [soil metagenome]
MSDDACCMANRSATKKPAPKAKQPTKKPAANAKKPAPKAKKPTKQVAAKPAAKRPKRPKRPKATSAASRPGNKSKKATARFDVSNVMKLVEHARKGDAHAILGIAPKLPNREVLSEPPDWNRKSYDRLLALYLGNDTFGHADWSGYIYDFAEHTYFRYDDEGHMLAQLNSDLGAIHASRDFGVFDEKRAVEYFRAALAGPAPAEVVVELEAAIAGSPKPLPRLAKLAANPQPEA